MYSNDASRQAEKTQKLQYLWLNEYDLAGQNSAWLKAACRERGLRVSGNRGELKLRLLSHADGGHPVLRLPPDPSGIDRAEPNR